jgi:hypothetical protein
MTTQPRFTKILTLWKNGLIARGETPKWDSDAGKYVYGDSSEAEESFGGNYKKETPKKEVAKVVDPQDDEDADDELPF